MIRYRILPYKQGSRGAKALATALGGKVLKLVDSKYLYQPGDVIINWGNTTLPWESLNSGLAIKNASNKLNFFRLMKEAHPDIIPDFWEKQEDIPDEAFPVVCRTVLAGHSGDGIVISPDRDSVVPANLYVKYLKKKDEYRVHVGEQGGEIVVISLQRKARKLSVSNPNWQVRNLAGGFIYSRMEVSPPVEVVSVAKRALEATGLDFGAVDVIWNEDKEKASVLEINTAAGLEGTTVDDYARFFQGLQSGD